jgi:hypothetical protein
MPRPLRAPLAVALAALLVAPSSQSDPTVPLLVVEQQRAAIVARLSGQWSEGFAALPTPRRLSEGQLVGALWALRADRLFAASLAGELEDVERVLSKASETPSAQQAVPKALGDLNADLTYTPVNPCRILDTRATVAGPLVPNVARTFDGYSTNFATRGGTGSSTVSNVDGAGNVAHATGITLGADGLPVVSYTDFGNGNLKVARCASATCMPYGRSR